VPIAERRSEKDVDWLGGGDSYGMDLGWRVRFHASGTLVRGKRVTHGFL